MGGNPPIGGRKQCLAFERSTILMYQKGVIEKERGLSLKKSWCGGSVKEKKEGPGDRRGKGNPISSFPNGGKQSVCDSYQLLGRLEALDFS